MTFHPALIGLYVYLAGIILFALVGLIEWAMSVVELRRIDRDDWARGEPWQRRHNTSEREREQARAFRSLSLVVYAAIWPLMVTVVLWRIATRTRKEGTHD
jgi:hypothetical protein